MFLFASTDRICPSIFGTLRFVTAIRTPSVRSRPTVGKFTELRMLPLRRKVDQLDRRPSPRQFSSASAVLVAEVRRCRNVGQPRQQRRRKVREVARQTGPTRARATTPTRRRSPGARNSAARVPGRNAFNDSVVDHVASRRAAVRAARRSRSARTASADFPFSARRSAGATRRRPKSPDQPSTFIPSRRSRFGNERADGAQADDTERLAVDFFALVPLLSPPPRGARSARPDLATSLTDAT